MDMDMDMNMDMGVGGEINLFTLLHTFVAAVACSS